jgi:hypothetical protein
MAMFCVESGSVACFDTIIVRLRDYEHRQLPSNKRRARTAWASNVSTDRTDFRVGVALYNLGRDSFDLFGVRQDNR